MQSDQIYAVVYWHFRCNSIASIFMHFLVMSLFSFESLLFFRWLFFCITLNARTVQICVDWPRIFFPLQYFSFNMVVSPVWTFLLCLCIWGMSHILLLLICVLYVLGYYFLRFGCSCGYASKFFYRQKIFFFRRLLHFHGWR